MARKRHIAGTPNNKLEPKRSASLTNQHKVSKGQERGGQSTPRRTKTSPPTTFPGFLSLPPEIRELILRKVVKSPKKIHLLRHKDEGLKVRRCAKHSLRRLHQNDYANLSRSALSVALTCRQLYLEASKLYYSLNTFKCSRVVAYGPDPPGLNYQPFLTAIGQINTGTFV